MLDSILGTDMSASLKPRVPTVSSLLQAAMQKRSSPQNPHRIQGPLTLNDLFKSMSQAGLRASPHTKSLDFIRQLSHTLLVSDAFPLYLIMSL